MSGSGTSQEVVLDRMTRGEVKQALDAGHFRAAIVPTGSIEQHLEHLALEHDIRSSSEIALLVARSMYPDVLVTAPVRIGMSEQHLVHPGSLSAKPGSWLAVMFDVVESLVRAGIGHILLLNGHGGNEQPVYGMLRQWQLYFQHPERQANVQFHSYFNLSRKDAERVCQTRVPGHAMEYETAVAMALFPENVRPDLIVDAGARLATPELGRQLADFAVQRVAEYLRGMLDGSNTQIQAQRLSFQTDPRHASG